MKHKLVKIKYAINTSKQDSDPYFMPLIATKPNLCITDRNKQSFKLTDKFANNNVDMNKGIFSVYCLISNKQVRHFASEAKIINSLNEYLTEKTQQQSIRKFNISLSCIMQV